MTCDVEGCGNPDVGTIHGAGQRCIDCMLHDLNKGEKEPLRHGVKIRAKVKRGTDTRDQDELLIEGRGEDNVEAASEFNAALQTAEQNDWAERLRALQPDGDGDD